MIPWPTRSIAVALLAFPLVGFVACGSAGDANSNPSGTGDTFAIFDYSVANSLGELAAASDLVVIAKVDDVTREEVKLPSPVDPSAEARRQDIVVHATITEVVWGDAEGLAELKLLSAEWFEAPGSDDPSNIARVDFPELPIPGQGETIVAFLRTGGGKAVPAAFAEVPGFGRLNGESVTFPAVKLSSDPLAPEITIPVASLDEVREAMDRVS